MHSSSKACSGATVAAMNGESSGRPSLAMMLAKERFPFRRLARQPEPSADMSEPSVVESFHEQGDRHGAMLPVYRFNAEATSRLLPRGGLLFDLGSGSGQYLAYLAQCRPDIRIVGLDLSRPMVERGRRMLRETGLADRVELRCGDMTAFQRTVPSDVAAISCVFALHHLSTFAQLMQCLENIQQVRERSGAAVWLFDHARPCHPATPGVFPALFTPEASRAFRNSSRDSLAASFSFGELTQACRWAGFTAMKHRQSMILRLYQTHALAPAQPVPDPTAPWQGPPLPDSAARTAQTLRRLFAGLSSHAR